MATSAKKDENGRPTLIAVSSADGVTIVPLQADPSRHALEYDDNNTGSDNGNNSGIAMVDDNGVAVFTALSSANDGTVIEVYINASTKKLLVNSN